MNRELARILDMLTPTTLAAISVELFGELEASGPDAAVEKFLVATNRALEANCGEEEAEQHRQWVRENF